MKCNSPDCVRESIACGFCDTHYRRWKKHGDASVNARITHGMFGTPVYISWKSMLARCCNPNNKCYGIYGGRGIKVCDRWLHSFKEFFADMGDRPEGCSLDRINPDGNHEPGNVRWATSVVQQRNKRTSITVQVNGESVLLADLAENLGVQSQTLRARMLRGWSDDQLSRPVKDVGQYK